MLYRFEKDNQFIEILEDRNGYASIRTSRAPWYWARFSTADLLVSRYRSYSDWKEVKMNHDPNDLPAICTCYDYTVMAPCKKCNTAFDNTSNEPCNCFSLYGAIRHKDGCLFAPTAGSGPYPTLNKKCTCGSTAVGSDKHSYYCDLEKK